MEMTSWLDRNLPERHADVADRYLRNGDPDVYWFFDWCPNPSWASWAAHLRPAED